jgi:uncharacterized iron-regulated membrane protein
VTDRLLLAYVLMAVLAVAFGALLWWWRYQSYPRAHARQQRQRRKNSEARAMAHLAASDPEQGR